MLRQCESLLRNIELLIKHKNKKWLDDKENKYFKHSVLYKFGVYFALVNKLEHEAFIEFLGKMNRQGKTIIMVWDYHYDYNWFVWRNNLFKIESKKQIASRTKRVYKQGSA